jgi:hypothetical protein
VFNTEVADTGGDFNLGTETFTAPVTGRYLVSGIMEVEGLATNHTAKYVYVVTSNRTYAVVSRESSSQVTTGENWNYSLITDMDASDTLFIRLTIGGGSKTVDYRQYQNQLSISLLPS